MGADSALAQCFGNFLCGFTYKGVSALKFRCSNRDSVGGWILDEGHIVFLLVKIPSYGLDKPFKSL